MNIQQSYCLRVFWIVLGCARDDVRKTADFDNFDLLALRVHAALLNIRSVGGWNKWCVKHLCHICSHICCILLPVLWSVVTMSGAWKSRPAETGTAATGWGALRAVRAPHTHAALEVLAKLAVLTVHHWLCMAALSADSAYITELPLGFKCLEGSFRNSRRKETLLVSHFGHALWNRKADWIEPATNDARRCCDICRF